ncbi:MAG: acyl-CoA dehydrogenase family protein [Gammaproteobacteria bacterium]|nr:acyl-CoA dehydrogenase family protein [Gammaproteobacteria bacterium]
MTDRSFLDWPFFADRHRQLAGELDDWCGKSLPHQHPDNVDEACRELVQLLAGAGWLNHAAPAPGSAGPPDVRTLCLIRETLAYHSGLADFAFAMQGLGSGAIALFGTREQKNDYLPAVRNGEMVAAFALSEPQAGSDVAALAATAVKDGGDYVINGEKTWISNGGIADFYTVFARTGEDAGAGGISAFIVDAGTAGLEIAERIEVIAPHPLARLEFRNCRVPQSNLLGRPDEGFGIAMATLDVFRSSVGAAALGFARRALEEALGYTLSRQLFGRTLAEMQMTRDKLADMALAVDAGALLVYRAAWTRDCVADRVTREAAMAKLHATESAQQVIDHAVQLFGGRGVTRGEKVEELYREIRALRVYEGASEIQKLIIARETIEKFQGSE